MSCYYVITVIILVDPRQWTAAHVRVWLAWARQHFPEVAPHQQQHGSLDGAQMMTLTPSQLQQHRVLVTHAGDRPGDSLFVTHRDLLKQTGAAGESLYACQASLCCCGTQLGGNFLGCGLPLCALVSFNFFV